MDQYTLNLIIVGASFALYIGIAIWARAGSTAEFYAANRGVNPVMNGMATAADWMSAASFPATNGECTFSSGFVTPRQLSISPWDMDWRDGLGGRGVPGDASSRKGRSTRDG